MIKLYFMEKSTFILSKDHNRKQSITDNMKLENLEADDEILLLVDVEIVELFQFLEEDIHKPDLKHRQRQ